MSSEFDELFPASGVQKMNQTMEFIPLAGKATKPAHYLLREKARHRAIVEMAAKGYDQKEVASRIGVCAATVGNTLAQPMLQKPLVDAVKRIHGADEEVVEIIKESVVAAVSTLADIVKDEKAKNNDRIAAAEAILNRRYGKPNQPINRGTDVDLSTLSDAELARMLKN